MIYRRGSKGLPNQGWFGSVEKSLSRKAERKKGVFRGIDRVICILWFLLESGDLFPLDHCDGTSEELDQKCF